MQTHYPAMRSPAGSQPGHPRNPTAVRRNRPLGLLLSALAIAAGACGGSGSGSGSVDSGEIQGGNARPVPAPPIEARIVNFAASASSIAPWEDVTLSYSFEGGQGVIDQGVGSVASGGLTMRALASTTTFTLTVIGETSTATQSVTVVVDSQPAAGPVIDEFTATPALVTAGDPVTIHFDVKGGNASIDHGVGPVSGVGTLTVTPAVTTVYTCTVVGPTGAEATATATVTVVPAPVITSFSITPPTLQPGGNTILCVFANGTGALDQGIGAVTTSQPIQVQPTTATTYSLTVTNSAGRTVVSSFFVGAAPTITGPSTWAQGIPTLWTCSFPTGSGVLDSPGMAAIPVTSGVPVAVMPSNTSPGFTTTFTLTVTTPTGPISSTKTLTNLALIVAPGTSQSFYLNQGTWLDANFGSAATAVLNPGNIQVASGSGTLHQFVRPPMATRYVLTVTEGAYAATTSLTVYPGTCLGGGTGHTLVLKSDGSVWAWGWNAYGQLGDNTQTDSYVPVRVRCNLPGNPFLTNVVAIAAGNEHNLALDLTGTVWAWGSNTYGQLGNGTLTMRMVATPVQGLPGIARSVSCGNDLSRVLLANGTAWAWGLNDHGQIGDGSTNNSAAPRQVLNLPDAVILGGGEAHGLAVKRDGTLMAWGWNFSGQVGDGSTTDRLSPVLVSGLANVAGVSVGGEAHSIAMLTDGSVKAWGNNLQGAIGDGTTVNRTLPVQVSGLAPGQTGPGTGPWTKGIWAGQAHSLAIVDTGPAVAGRAWGRNNYGQLGTGTTSQGATTMPNPISTSTPFASMAGGWYHSMAVAASFSPGQGQVFAWGKNTFGQVGTGSPSTYVTSPTPMNLALW